MELVYIGAGSNLGDRELQISRAGDRISDFCSNVRRSRLYETAPRYLEEQPLFINTVFCGKTRLEPHKLLLQLQKIEDEAGRDRDASGWMGPRPIDLDILLYGSRSIETPELIIPHRGIEERGFVLFPLLELDPLIKNPLTGAAYADCIAALPPQGIYYHTVMPL